MSYPDCLPGTEKNFCVWVDSDELWSETVIDADGNPVDLTDCILKMLIKTGRGVLDANATAEATITIISAVAGTITIEVDRSVLDPAKTYVYDAKLEFPADYATVNLRGKQFIFMRGELPPSQEATRDATP